MCLVPSRVHLAHRLLLRQRARRRISCDRTRLAGTFAPVFIRTSKRASADPFSNRSHRVQVSSRTLGWVGLNYERRDYRPSSHALGQDSGEHLVFVSLTTARIREQQLGRAVEHEVDRRFV